MGWLIGSSGRDSRARDHNWWCLVLQTCRRARTLGLVDSPHNNTTDSLYLSGASRKAALDLVDQADPDDGSRAGALYEQRVRNMHSVGVDSRREGDSAFRSR